MAEENQDKSLAIIEGIEERIYLIRGQKVMIDSDLAEIYQVETKVLNQAVKRNVNRFPEDFMFQLTAEEIESLSKRSQIVTASKRNARFRPFAFTEHGAVMLASVLNSATAIEASIKVVRAFVEMRSILALHQELAERIKELENVTDKQARKFGVVAQLLSEIMRDPKFIKRKIGFATDENNKKK